MFKGCFRALALKPMGWGVAVSDESLKASSTSPIQTAWGQLPLRQTSFAFANEIIAPNSQCLRFLPTTLLTLRAFRYSRSFRE